MMNKKEKPIKSTKAGQNFKTPQQKLTGIYVLSVKFRTVYLSGNMNLTLKRNKTDSTSYYLLFIIVSYAHHIRIKYGLKYS